MEEEEAPLHSSMSLDAVNGHSLTTSTSALRIRVGKIRHSRDKRSWNRFEHRKSNSNSSSKKPDAHTKRQGSPQILLTSSASRAPPSGEASPLWWWPTRSVVACAKPPRHRHRLPVNQWPPCSHFLSKLALLLNCHILALNSTAKSASTSTSTSASDSASPPRPRPPAPPRPTFSLFRSISTVTLCLTTLTHFSRVLLFCLIVLHSTTTAVFSIDDNEIEKSNVNDAGSNITKILNAFFDSGYDKRVRPNYGGLPVQVNVTMYIIGISSVSEVQMDFTSDFYFRQKWTDNRLSFTPTGGITELVVGADFAQKIWVPDTFFANEKVASFHTATTPNTFLRISSNGDIYRSIR